MGHIIKETGTISIRSNDQIVGAIDDRIDADPRFVSRSEFIVFCIQQGYGAIIHDLAGEMKKKLSESAIKDQASFDSFLVNILAEEYRSVKRSNQMMDLIFGEPVTIQARLSKEFIDSIDALCTLMCVKRTEFIKYCIDMEMTGRLFDFNCVDYEFRRIDGNDTLFVKLGDDWTETIQNSVKNAITESMKRFK